MLSERSMAKADKIMFYDIFTPALLTIVFILELLGIAIICYGTGVCTLKLVKTGPFFKHSQLKSFGHELTYYLKLSLDYLLGAEIINTIVVRTLEELVIVAMIILLRGVLGYIVRQETPQDM